MPSLPDHYVTAYCPREIEPGIACECDLEVKVWHNGDFVVEDVVVPAECGSDHVLTPEEIAAVERDARHTAATDMEHLRNCSCRPGRPCSYHDPY